MNQDDFLYTLSRGTKEHVTVDDTSYIKHMLPGLDECQCERLHRSLPFRGYIEQEIVWQNKDTSDITYASVGSGGLLFDWIVLNKLIMHGTQHLSIIAIDPAYADVIDACNTHKIDIHTIAQTTNQPYAKTIQTFLNWFRDAKAYIQTLQSCTLYIYTSTEAYQSACERHDAPKADIYVSIDDDTHIPDFEDATFRETFFAQSYAICAPRSRIYYLFYAPYRGDEYRHAIIGQVYPEKKRPILSYIHAYGIEKVTHQYTNLFIPEHVLPFTTNGQSGIQINDTVFFADEHQSSISILEKMLTYPLDAISPKEQDTIIKEIPKLLTTRAQHQDE